MIDVEELIAGLDKFAEVGEAQELIRRIKTGGFFAALYNNDLSQLVTLLAKALQEVGQSIPELRGKDKHKALVKWADDCVDLPTIIDSPPINLDKRIFESLVGPAVEWLKKNHGHLWAKEVE